MAETPGAQEQLFDRRTSAREKYAALVVGRPGWRALIKHELVTLGLADDRPLEVRLLAKDTMTKLMAFEGEDPKIRASIYATARMAFQAWNEPAIAHSASLDPISST